MVHHKFKYSFEKNSNVISMDAIKVSNIKKSLSHHKNNIHLKIRYRCDWKECNKTFSLRVELNIHKKSVHLKGLIAKFILEVIE